MNANPDETPPTLTRYLVGFMLARLLTVTAFGLIFACRQSTLPEGISRDTIIAAVALLAVLQILVHLHYFLHLNFRPWPNLMRLQAILFALFIIVIMVGGTLWIMYDLNVQMQPPH